MVDPDPHDLLAVPARAAHQAGAFTRQQAGEEGWTASQLTHRICRGHWRRLGGRALVSAHAPLRPTTGTWAVRLTWPDAVASHSTAALAYRWPVPDDPVLHAITRTPRRSLRDLKAHVVRLDEHDVSRIGWDGPLLTSPRRTAVDCLRTLPPDDAEQLLAWCLTRRVLTREHLAEVVRATYQAWGTPQLVTLLRRSQGGALSEAERRLHRILRTAGLTGWVANVPVHDPAGVVAVVDVLFAAHRLVVEVDGWSTHAGRGAFVTDRRRQNRLVAAGYVVLRFTWDDLRDRADDVVAEIRDALERAQRSATRA